MTTEKTDYTLRSATEAKTHELFDFERKDAPLPWTSNRQLVGNVFKALHYSSMPLRRIQVVAAAIGCYDLAGLPADWLQTELTELTRAKALRSSMHRKERHYEVNY